MKKFSLYFSVLICIACNNNPRSITTTDSNSTVKDSANAQKQITKSTSITDTTIKKKLLDTIKKSNIDTLNRLLGIWIPKGSDNPAFSIKKSTIYYPEHFKSYKYTILGDSIKIRYEGYSESFAYRLRKNDTLILSNNDYGESLYYRKKD